MGQYQPMIEYEVTWVQCPTAYNTSHTVFVEAATADDAEKIAHDHIKRKHGVGGWIKFEVRESQPVPAGRVIRTGGAEP